MANSKYAAFIAAAEEGNMTAAAQKRHKTYRAKKDDGKSRHLFLPHGAPRFRGGEAAARRRYSSYSALDSICSVSKQSRTA